MEQVAQTGRVSLFGDLFGIQQPPGYGAGQAALGVPA